MDGSLDRWIDDCEDMQAGIKVCNHCVCGMDGWISTNSSPSLRMDTYALGSPFTQGPPPIKCLCRGVSFIRSACDFL